MAKKLKGKAKQIAKEAQEEGESYKTERQEYSSRKPMRGKKR